MSNPSASKMPSIDLNNKDDWDDTALVRSWNAAVAEYKKYHSIKARGQKVEDVLSAHELEQLRGNASDPAKTKTKANAKAMAGAQEHKKADAIKEDSELTKELELSATVEESGRGCSEEPAMQVQNSTATTTAAPGEAAFAEAAPIEAASAPSMAAAPIPQPLLDGQDEGLKNLMMSWYYAGYYTGLYEGQQKATREAQDPEAK